MAHPELHPIEMVLENLKRVVKNSNFQFKLELLEECATTEMAKIDRSVCSTYCKHAIEEEEKYGELAEAMDRISENNAPVIHNETSD